MHNGKKLIFLLLILLSGLSLSSTKNIVSAQPSMIPDMYNLILCGQVTAKDRNGYGNMAGPLYTIKIEDFYKGNVSNSTLSAIGSEDSNGPRGMTPVAVGQRALFYVNLIDEKYYMLSPYTAIVSKCAPSYSPTPLGQYEFGVNVQDIYCQNGTKLIIKSEDGSPACVMPNTANILVERGWGHLP